MKKYLLYIILLPFFVISVNSFSQTTCTNPLPPMLTNVSVQPETGNTNLTWTLSPSPDVAAYIVYYYIEDQGNRQDVIDTLWNPAATSYVVPGIVPNYKSVTYAIQSFRKPSCISGVLKINDIFNVINTIFTEITIDTCNNKIVVKWNSYPSQPVKVSNYSILFSINGSTFNEAGKVGSEVNSFTLNSFSNNATYCFIVRANLEGGSFSTSNKACLSTKMQRPPQWINADQATVNDDNSISLSYTIDPQSEIKSFGLDRKKDTDNDFTRLAVIQSSGNKVIYTDKSATAGQRYIYRLGAINNCGNPVLFSPVSVNMVLELSASGGTVILKWNKYREWAGYVDHYKVFLNTGNGFTERAILQPDDTTFTINYSDIMYEIEAGKYCFVVEAYEGINPHGISGLSRSDQVCSETVENITVPNAFTPDNDMINDLFRPVLSFTPTGYRLLITDRRNNRLFETTSFQVEWDGTRNGVSLPEDAYLWYLTVKTPSGKTVSRTGTVTIIKNR
jgi:gliding motility-associated-like protein